jgi:ATP-binding cassette, subfamily B, bacterial
MSDRMRGLSRLFVLSFRVDPVRSIVDVSVCAIELGVRSLFALWLKFLADGLATHNSRTVMIGAIGMAASIATSEVTNWFRVPMGETLRDKTSHALDVHLMELAGKAHTIEHHERADYIQELELLRGSRNTLANCVSALAYNVGNFARLAVSAVLLGGVDLKLLVLPLFAIPAVVIASRVVAWNERAREESSEDDRSANHVQYMTGEPTAAKEIRVFGLGNELISRYVDRRTRASRVRNRASIKAAAIVAAGWTFFAFGYIGAIALVVVRALRGESTVGDVLLAMNLAQQVSGQVSGVASSVTWLQGLVRIADRYVWLVDYAKKLPVLRGAPAPMELREGIRFKEIGFTYPGTEARVLSDVDLFLPAGSTVAFVGDNGAGKTTLVKLLLRYYEPDEGRIMVDGSELREIAPEDWRSRVSGGFQDFMDFEFLARETVGAGDLPRLSDNAAVGVALDRSGSQNVIDELPRHLDTQLGVRFWEGEQLSVGQWQKLAIARAMMRDDPLLLILDEPTAALDAMTEHALFERYVDTARQRASRSITVLVSHRFSTVRMADLIVVVDGGRITESGSHEELMSRQGLYAELYELQASAYR